MNDKFWDVTILCLVAVGFLLAGLSIGSSVQRVSWEQWCLENKYAEYDKNTGELILFDNAYVQNWMKENFPELLKEKLDKSELHDTM